MKMTMVALRTNLQIQKYGFGITGTAIGVPYHFF